MQGISDLIEKQGIKKSKLRVQMEKANIPFSYNNYETFYNLVNGKTRPRDPIVYLYLAHVLSVTVEEIILRYSDVNHIEEKAIKKEVDSIEISVRKIDKGNW